MFLHDLVFGLKAQDPPPTEVVSQLLVHSLEGGLFLFAVWSMRGGGGGEC